MIGKILGERYEIIEEIGKGGMAHVYKAKCILLNRIVALKILRDDLEGGEEFLNRFKSEARAAASLTHSNIVAIFDVGVDEGINYIVMEYVDGITLKEYICQNRRLSFEETLDIAYQICDAMQAAHEKNIVHRDIKPHNILITEDKKIKVTDFGIARFGTGNTITSNDDILGSVHYISPEQAKGESVDSRSDIYSLGIAMYEMLTGKVPFDADTPVAVAMMQIEDLPTIPAELEYEIPLSLWQIIFKAMSKDPDLRYQSALDFKTDIQNITQDPDYFIQDGYLYFDGSMYEEENVNEQNVSANTSLKRRTKIGMIILGAVTSLFIVVTVLFVATGGLSRMFSGDDTELVPSLIGKTYAEAEAYCKKHNITLIYKEEGENHEYDPGVIIFQNPRENTKNVDFDVIEVTVNKSTDLLVLDDYTGDYYSSVEQELTDKGFTVKIYREISKSDNGIILRQSPEPGRSIDSDTVITFYVSSGIHEEDHEADKDNSDDSDENNYNDSQDEQSENKMDDEVDESSNESSQTGNNSGEDSVSND
ncbi:MAG: protein kinase [Clostridia bacterium]|nr:protein kinase [Clostridia bacterium]